MKKRKLGLILLFLALFGLGLPNAWVMGSAVGCNLKSVKELPERAVVVVLGVSEFHPEDGYAILSYHPRLDAAAELLATGKVEVVVVSGTANQVDGMAAELARRGITQPVVRDPYGWRTLDSVARAKAAYPGRPLVFVSQSWHNDRAIWIAHQMRVTAYGYAADNGADFRSRVLAPGRDILAKVKAVVDWVRGFPLETPIPADQGNR